MKKAIIIIAVLGLVTIGMTTAAMALPLPIPGSVVPTGAGFPGGTSAPIATTGPINFTNAYYSGIVMEEVRTNSTGLLFAYYLTINPGTTYADPVTRMTVTDFNNWILDVDAFGAADRPDTITRTGGPGATVGFDFGISGTADPGITGASDTMWIQTNAQFYTQGGITLQNGKVEDLIGFQPTIPEPGSAMLLGMGLLGVAGKLRKRFFA